MSSYCHTGDVIILLLAKCKTLIAHCSSSEKVPLETHNVVQSLIVKKPVLLYNKSLSLAIDRTLTPARTGKSCLWISPSRKLAGGP